MVMKKVIAFGSFDILHKGHEHYLKEAKSYGDFLIVVVARDKSIIKIKGKKPQNDENSRLGEIKKLDFVDEAVLGDEKDFFKSLDSYKPDVICLGYDQKTISIDDLKKGLEKRKLTAKIVRAKPFKENIYKSSLLKNKK
jgi:FAD synthetase